MWKRRVLPALERFGGRVTLGSVEEKHSIRIINTHRSARILVSSRYTTCAVAQPTLTTRHPKLHRHYAQSTSPVAASDLRLEVTKSGERLDSWLTRCLMEERGKKGAYSRTMVQRLIQAGRVTINNKACKSKHRVLERGEVVLINTAPLPNVHVSIPFDLKERIISEDDDIIVINKPAGVVVHPGTLKEEGTLVEVLLHHLIEQRKATKKEEESIGNEKEKAKRKEKEEDKTPSANTEPTIPKQKVNKQGNRYFMLTDEEGRKYKVYLVQRLDKDTSGVLVVAKNDAARQHLVDQMKSRTMKREYLAICFGKFKEDSGVIKTLIGRDADDRHKMKVFELNNASAEPHNAKTAESHWEQLDYFPGKPGKARHGDGKGWGYSLIRWKLVTGRMHQIRVHASHSGHAVLGDPIYSGKKMKQIASIGTVPLRNQFLHAFQLSLVHPTDGTLLTLCAPLPEYFEDLLEYFKKGK